MSSYWTTLSHNGVNLPDLYAPSGLSVRVRGMRVSLSPLAEEMAYHLAKKKDTPYISDPVFRSNFMQDFLKELPEWCRGTPFEEVDFSEPFAKADSEKAAKDALSKEEKKAAAAERKERREALKARFGVALLDGKQVDIANWMVEPPGLFAGRGQHPLRGRWKPRVTERDVILNLGEGALVPSGDWKGVVHDHSSMWMAKWVDKLTDKEKYVWLHESSPLQQSRSRAKYDNAMKVGSRLRKIRSRIERELDSKDSRRRQVATVCYLIDRLGMRVGDEKDEDEADTVGASTLRVEHLRFDGYKVKFDFLGKDSIAAESELYYRLNGGLHFGTIESMFNRVRPKEQWSDQSGRGIIVPEDCVEVLTVDDLVQERSKVGWTKVRELISHEVAKPLYRIASAGGRSVRVTGDHSIFSTLNEYRAVCIDARELNAKSALASVTSLPIHVEDVSEANGIRITDALLTFLGLWIANGCYYPRGVIIAGGGDESVEEFVSQFSELYHSAVLEEIQSVIDMANPNSDNYSKARLRTVPRTVVENGLAFNFSIRENGDIWCHSTTLKRMLETLQIHGDSHTKTIPEWVMCLSDRQVACFLKGYFSGDGFVSSSLGNPTSSSVNPTLSSQIQTLLLRLGIDSTLHRARGGGYSSASASYVVKVGRANEKNLFRRKVGFLQDSKQSHLWHSNPRYKTYGIRWRKVKSITEVGPAARVYDISTDNERFVVNHLLVHNSVRWEKVLVVKPSEIKVIRNLREFTADKSPETQVFHHVNSRMVNQFLSSISPGLTAKVFRTYHATEKTREALKSTDMRGADDVDKLYFAKEASLQAAVFCNHQRTPPKTWEQSLERKRMKLEEARTRPKVNEGRVKKLEKELDFYVRTKEYNLNTSLKNYIDPRVYKAWCDYVGLEWKTIYSKSLQKKFSWVKKSNRKWKQSSLAGEVAARTGRSP